jgi:excinuclease ABC subunit B
VNGTVVLYADNITGSMKMAIDESERRRRIQLEYNRIHHITPATILKNIDDILGSVCEADYVTIPAVAEKEAEYLTKERIDEMIMNLTEKMKEAAKRLEFEEAAVLRDQIRVLEKREFETLLFA